MGYAETVMLLRDAESESEIVIERMDLDGKNPALFAAGFRNQFDAAFNPDGELFTFDSDMEWDEGLPWYRAVRVCHCIPGADFVWRTGAANTPNYYIDSLPPVVETGRGSPTGVEFYDHSAFPAKYRGAFFMCDWSIGTMVSSVPCSSRMGMVTRSARLAGETARMRARSSWRSPMDMRQ